MDSLLLLLISYFPYLHIVMNNLSVYSNNHEIEVISITLNYVYYTTNTHFALYVVCHLVYFTIDTVIILETIDINNLSTRLV